MLRQQVAQLKDAALGEGGGEPQVHAGQGTAGDLLEGGDVLDRQLDFAPPLAHLALDQDHGVVGDQVAELLELVGEEGDGEAARRGPPARSGP